MSSKVNGMAASSELCATVKPSFFEVVQLRSYKHLT